MNITNYTSFDTKLKGNIIPSEWYNIIMTCNKRPDSLSITILSELVFWLRRNHNNSSWQTSYKYFENKFSYHREALRRAFVRLEKSNILQRTFKTIIVQGQKYSNVLFINLNLSHPLFKSILEKKKICTPYPQIAGDILIEKKEKNRSSSKSNFIKIEKEKLLAKKEKQKEPININRNCFGVKASPKKNLNDEQFADNKQTKAISFTKHSRKATKVIKTKQNFDNTSLTSKKPKSFFNRTVRKFSLVRRPLKEYLPITEETAERLNYLSGREFSCRFINKLAEKLGNKNAELKFYKEELFLQYMSKVLKNEMRNPYLVNNINFKFKADSEEEREEDKINQYLDEIERSTLMTEEARLRRKIAGIYEGKVAYSMLAGINVKSNENELVISHSREVRLNEIYKQSDRLLKEIRLIYGNQIKTIKWEVKERSQIHKEYVTAEGIANEKINHEKVNKPNEIVDLGASIEESTTLWGKVKAELIRNYGTATYISWFSKLEAQENLEDNLLTLKAPTEFINRWIKTNYEKTIETICQNFSIQLICL